MAQRTGGTLLLLPTGTLYRGTCKQYLIVRVQMSCTNRITEKRDDAKELGLLFLSRSHRTTKRNQKAY
jgi:hypothetical protein